MSKSNTFENDFLRLIFNAAGIAGIADNASASPIANLYVSLHTSDPGETGDQTTGEVTYTGYARVAVARSAAGWTVNGASVSPTNPITFPAGTAGSGTAGYWGVGTSPNGAGKLLFSGTITPTIATGNGVTPQLSTATTITED